MAKRTVTPTSADIPDDQFSDEEAARRRDEVVKRMIATPPQPHKPAKPARTGRSSKKDAVRHDA
jgi:hypothetical protein